MGAGSFHGSERLLVLTNRLPFSFRRGRGGLERRSAVGGLASALDPVLRKRGGTWVGWPGIDFEPGEDLELRGSPYRIRPISTFPTACRLRVSPGSPSSRATRWALPLLMGAHAT